LSKYELDVLAELDNIFDNGDGLKCGKVRIVNKHEFLFNLDDNI
jgi:hypothetical protein